MEPSSKISSLKRDLIRTFAQMCAWLDRLEPTSPPTDHDRRVLSFLNGLAAENENALSSIVNYRRDRDSSDIKGSIRTSTSQFRVVENSTSARTSDSLRLTLREQLRELLNLTDLASAQGSERIVLLLNGGEESDTIGFVERQTDLMKETLAALMTGIGDEAMTE